MKRKSRNQPFLSGISKIDIIVMVIMTLILGLAKPILAIVGILLTLVAVTINLKVTDDNSRAFSEYLDGITAGLDETITTSVIFNPLPLCIIDNKGTLMWYNEKFEDLFDDLKRTKSNIYDLTGVKLHELDNEELKDKTILVKSKHMKERKFRVIVSQPQNSMQGARMLHWVETTTIDQIKEKYRDERICIAYVNVDNYDDIIASVPDERKAGIGAEIENTIRTWATRSQAGFMRMGKAKYALIFDFRTLENIEANKFPILDEIRSIETGGEIPASLSIGVGASGKTPAQTEEYAAAALDLCLGRGGDQAVVRKGSIYDYYGGKLQTVEKRNKGKSRIIALALRQLIDQAPHIFVMGHVMPDMDCFGASLGIARIAKNRGKKANIVIDSPEAIDILYNLAKTEKSYNFLSAEQAEMEIGKEDLLIIVDTYKPGMTSCPKLLEIAEKIVVIDHHRRSTDSISNPTLLYLEPYASSASELVTEIFQYIATEKKSIGKLEAEALLAGIALDTKNFAVKTGVRTFDAASWLRRQGADTTHVKQFFRVDINSSKLEAKIVSQASLLPGNIVISYFDEPTENISMLISMAANALLEIRDIRASIVLGVDKDGRTRVSARSFGDLNVQRIMEKLGGGGHLTMAGAQLDVSMEEAIRQVEMVTAEFLEEERQELLAKEAAEKEKAKAAMEKEEARIAAEKEKLKAASIKEKFKTTGLEKIRAATVSEKEKERKDDTKRLQVPTESQE